MSAALTIEQQLVIEAVAAQLHDRDIDARRPVIFWSMIDERTRERFRALARRKLRVGEIDGWWKTLPAPDGGRFHSRERYHAAQVEAAE